MSKLYLVWHLLTRIIGLYDYEVWLGGKWVKLIE